MENNRKPQKRTLKSRMLLALLISLLGSGLFLFGFKLSYEFVFGGFVIIFLLIMFLTDPRLVAKQREKIKKQRDLARTRKHRR